MVQHPEQPATASADSTASTTITLRRFAGIAGLATALRLGQTGSSNCAPASLPAASSMAAKSRPETSAMSKVECSPSE